MFIRHCLLAVIAFMLVIGANAAHAAEALSSSKVRWGAVGHNDRKDWGGFYPYNYVSLERHIALLKEAGLTAYRSGCNFFTCKKLADLTKENNILFLRSIEMRPDEKLDEKGNYKRGYDHAFEEGRRYKGYIHYYEASNELDNWVGMTGNGYDRSEYNARKYPLARGFLKGLIAGLHAADPTIKVAVDNAGWCHYGFVNALWEDGVRWDITAIHWYQSHGDLEKAGCAGKNVAEIHAAFGKPIWITEFNADIAAKTNDQQAAAEWISKFIPRITEIAPKYNIQAAFVYELFDEPNMHGAEKHYGIADEKGNPKPVFKAISNAVKLKYYQTKKENN